MVYILSNTVIGDKSRQLLVSEISKNIILPDHNINTEWLCSLINKSLFQLIFFTCFFFTLCMNNAGIFLL